MKETLSTFWWIGSEVQGTGNQAYVSEVPSALLPSAWLHPLKLPLPLETQPSAQEPNTACGPVGDISYLNHDSYSMNLNKCRAQNMYNMEYLPCLKKNLMCSLFSWLLVTPSFFLVCLFQGVTLVESCSRQTVQIGFTPPQYTPYTSSWCFHGIAVLFLLASWAPLVRMTMIRLSIHTLLAPSYHWCEKSHRIFKLCPLKDTFISPRWAFFREAVLTGFLSPILLRKLIEVLRAGGFVPERVGSSETRDVGMACT